MTTKSKENGHAPLTLLNGKKVVTFRHLSVRDDMKRQAEIERQRMLWLANFPELKKISGTPAMEEHADFPEYAGQLEMRCEYAPWLLAACNEPLTVDDILDSDMDEVTACAVAVRRLNTGSRLYFPRRVQIADDVEKAENPDPN